MKRIMRKMIVHAISMTTNDGEEEEEEEDVISVTCTMRKVSSYKSIHRIFVKHI